MSFLSSLYEMLLYAIEVYGEALLVVYTVVWSDPLLSALMYLALPLLVSFFMEIWRWSSIDECLKTIIIVRALSTDGGLSQSESPYVLSTKALARAQNDSHRYLDTLNSVHKDVIGGLAGRVFSSSSKFSNFAIPSEFKFVRAVGRRWRGVPLLAALVLALINVSGYIMVHNSGFIITGDGGHVGAPDGPYVFVFFHMLIVMAFVLISAIAIHQISFKRWNKYLTEGFGANNLIVLHPVLLAKVTKNGH